jgi:hypothetical protein
MNRRMRAKGKNEPVMWWLTGDVAAHAVGMCGSVGMWWLSRNVWISGDAEMCDSVDDVVQKECGGSV